MKILLIALVLVAFVTASNYVEQFEKFKKDFNRKYPGTEAEAKRFANFIENMKKAEKLGRLNPLATFGVNEFADYSAAEFKIRHSAEKFYKAKAKKVVPALFTPEQVKAAASSIDWRQKGAVTYVKNQGQCGSCWSFSSTGSIEGQWFLAGNTLIAVSEQEFVSCDTTDDGCNGGLMDNAWSWLVSAKGGHITSEDDYPYVSGNGQVPACKLPKPTVATISGHEDLPQNEDQMATWMTTNGPISIGVDATSWQTYTGGIMTNCVSSQVDHGVLAVGFDNTNNPPYWIVKNSWGQSWGEEGYIRIQKGTDQCLITSGPCSSKVSSGPAPPTSPPSNSGSSSSGAPSSSSGSPSSSSGSPSSSSGSPSSSSGSPSSSSGSPSSSSGSPSSSSGSPSSSSGSAPSSDSSSSGFPSSSSSGGFPSSSGSSSSGFSAKKMKKPLRHQKHAAL